MAVSRPICFVLMPHGRMVGGDRPIDFDRVYQDFIVPVVAEAGLQPLRSDRDVTQGAASTAWLDQLILSECAIADLTSADAGVFYALGLRHAVRERSTVLVAAESGAPMPFDLTSRVLRYGLSPDGTPRNVDATRGALRDRVRQARAARTGRRWFDLVDGSPEIQRLKTDVFRDAVSYSPAIKQQLAGARQIGADAVAAVESGLGEIALVDSAIVVDLLLSYRAVKAWDHMIALVGRMSPPLARAVMVREQLGFALNRAGRGDEAERVLRTIIDEHGPSSETCSLLGRVYKDRWHAAVRAGQSPSVHPALDQAIAAYLAGFESDWRDAFPGINVITLMEIKEPPDPRRLELIPVVRYAVERRIAAGDPDYWDYATLIELAVLGDDEAGAVAALDQALERVREVWEPESTARTLSLIRSAREQRDDPVEWVAKLETALLRGPRT